MSRRFGADQDVARSPERVEPRVMARAGAYLYAAGATLALLWLALPHPAAANDLALAGILASAYAGGGMLWRFGERLPIVAFDFVVGLGSVLISAAVLLSGHATPFVLFYLWSNLYAWYFFPRHRAAVQLALIGLLYGVVIGVGSRAEPEPSRGGLIPLTGPGAATWMITLGTLLVAGLLVMGLRERVDRLIRGLTEERNFVSSVVETSAALVMIFGLDGRLLAVNRSCEDVTGYTSDAMRDSHISEFLLVPEEIETARRHWESVVAGERATFDSHLVARGGERRLIAWSAVLGRDAAGDPDHVVATGVDITERKRGERELKRRALRQAAVAELGRRGLEGTPVEQLAAQSVRLVANHLELDHAEVWEQTRYTGELLLTAAVGGCAAGVGEATLPAHADIGRELSRASTVRVPIPGPRRPFGTLAAHSDDDRRRFTRDETLFLESVAHVLAAAIERLRSEESIRHNALHDPLTGLPNRALFLDRLAHVMSRRDPRGSQAAVMFLDLDNFKLINDSLGHEAGDRMLCKVGPRLAAALRPSDTVARLGGDEFVVLAEEVGDGRDAMVMAERLQGALEQPFVLDGEDHFLTASIGVALATGRYEEPDALLRDADAAMYRAKERGRSQCELYDDAMRSQVIGRLRLENALRGVIERDELRAYYQPIVSLDDGSIVGFEALMRWHHDGLGPVSPIEFIPIAEDTGLIVPLGAWMLEEVCRQIALWQQELGTPPPPVSVNLSPRQVAHAELVPTVAQVLERTGVDPSRLALEITESVLISEADSPWNTLHALKKLGVTLMLDDFGTGYSSLSYLKRFPVDVLKVDRTFVDGLGCEAEDSAIVKAVVGMARALDLVVVAEGVENETQVDCLRKLGCERAQGFFFGRPRPAADTTALLRPDALVSTTVPWTAPSQGSRLESSQNS